MSNISAKTLRCALILLGVLLCLQVSELVSKLRMLERLHRTFHPESIEYTYMNGDHPEALPVHIKQAAMNVEWLDDEVYGLYAQDDWESLFPHTTGFVTLGIPPTEFNPNSTSGYTPHVFGVTMYHQLHCLNVFRTSYTSAKAHAFVWPGNGTWYDFHLNHCLNYMRQMILCAADTTLMPATELDLSFGLGRYEASSDGVVHRCRDWTQVRRFVEQHRTPLF